MTSYLTSIDTFSLSRIVVEIYSDDLEDFEGWPLDVIWGKKNILTNQKLIHEFLSTSIDTFSLSCTISEIFDFKFWGLKLTFDL